MDNNSEIKDKKNDVNKYRFNVKLLYRRTALIIYDIISIIAASYLAVIIRYEFQLDAVPSHFRQPIEQFMPLNILVTIALFYAFRLYSSLWAYAGEAELQNIVISCFLSGVFNAVGLQFFKQREQAVPKSYYFLYIFLLITFEFVSRFSYRFFRNQKHKQQNKNNRISVMIIGAGEAANMIVKEIINSNFSTMKIKCIIDDDRGKWGKYIQGVKVTGGRDRIVECADLYEIDQIILAVPSLSASEKRKILEICQKTNCKVRSLAGNVPACKRRGKRQQTA
jgi:FlaA1/EpsC-like NDP-sugar epimerase